MTEHNRSNGASTPKGSASDRGHRAIMAPSSDLRLRSARSIARLSPPPHRRLWGKLFYDRMLGMIHGPRGGGKTFFVLSIAVAIATGARFLGSGPRHPCKVAVLDGEMGFRLLQERLKTVSKSLGVEPPKRLLLLNPDLVDGALPSLATLDGQRKIDSILPRDVDLIIVDNFSCWNTGGREDADGWTTWNTWLLAQKRKGRTVIVVHHTGKSGDQRGTSKREDSLDFVIALKPVDNPAHPGALSFALEWTKARHLRRDQAARMRATLTYNDDHGPTWVHDALPSPRDRATEARALAAQGLKQTEIADMLKVNKATISRDLRGGGRRT